MGKEIFGITGKKGHGKDTFAHMLQAASGGAYHIDHFARVLKEMATRIWGIPLDTWSDPVLKEAGLPEPFVMDDYLDAMSEQTGLMILPAGLVAHTPRRILQYFGAEYGGGCVIATGSIR